MIGITSQFKMAAKAKPRQRVNPGEHCGTHAARGLNHDPLDLVEAGLVAPAIVKLRPSPDPGGHVYRLDVLVS